MAGAGAALQDAKLCLLRKAVNLDDFEAAEVAEDDFLFVPIVFDDIDVEDDNPDLDDDLPRLAWMYPVLQDRVTTRISV